jgi:hypothetical protein
MSFCTYSHTYLLKMFLLMTLKLISHAACFLGLLLNLCASTARLGTRKQYKLLMMSRNCDATCRVKYAYDRLGVNIFIWIQYGEVTLILMLCDLQFFFVSKRNFTLKFCINFLYPQPTSIILGARIYRSQPSGYVTVRRNHNSIPGTPREFPPKRLHLQWGSLRALFGGSFAEFTVMSLISFEIRSQGLSLLSVEAYTWSWLSFYFPVFPVIVW